jgi:hypothetical protein
MSEDPWTLVDALLVPDAELVDAAIRYLEADPWQFRTGYAKGRLMRRLRSAELDDQQRARLRPVLARYATAGQRCELTEACRLARRHHIPGLRDDLVAVLWAADEGAAIRALRILFAMRRPRLSDRDLARGRHLLLGLLRGGIERGSTQDARWVRPCAARLWPPDERAVLEVVANGEPSLDRSAARRVLRTLDPSWRPGPKHGSSAMR